MAAWYYSTNGQQAGPVELEQLRGLVAAGQVRPSDMVWREGMPNWLPASTVAELSVSPQVSSAVQVGSQTKRLWHYTAAGRQAGPVETEQLKGLLASGQVSAADLVWSDGMPNWVPASTVSELTGGYAPTAQTFGSQGTTGFGQQGSVGGGTQIPQYYSGQSIGFGSASFAKDAQTAMICSIIGIVCCGILGIVGLVLGNKAKSNMQRTGNFEGSGMATAAIIIGWISIGFMVLAVVVQVISISARR